MRVAVMFPGQGAQQVGMGRAFEKHPLYRAHLDRAEEVLDIPLRRILDEGPAELLTRTEIAQPALLTVATGIGRVWQAESGLQAAAVAGHSLGEYSALVAAGVLSFEDALRLVQLRGKLMQQACEDYPGGMIAVLKPELSALQGLCEAAGDELVIANYNSSQQVVLAGTVTLLARVQQTIRERKLGRAIPLPVAGAFHSPLMQSARKALSAAIAALPFAEAQVPVVMNVSAQAVRDPVAIKALLQEQLTAPVRWQQSLETLAELKITQALEMGAHTLGPLWRQVLPDIPVASLRVPEDLDGFRS
ncbi:MAG: ACP S-malonyltransferase [Candidatus Sericytochromatia bacterium]